MNSRLEVLKLLVPKATNLELSVDKLPELVEKHRGLLFSFEGHQAEMSESMSSLRATSRLTHRRSRLTTPMPTVSIPVR